MTKIYKIMVRFAKQAVITLLCFGGLLATKCINLNNEPCIARLTLEFNSKILLMNCVRDYHPFIVSLNRCNRNCNTL